VPFSSAQPKVRGAAIGEEHGTQSARDQVAEEEEQTVKRERAEIYAIGRIGSGVGGSTARNETFTSENKEFRSPKAK